MPACLTLPPHPLPLRCRFSSWGELNAFQTCQSKQSLYVNSVVNKNFKQILTAPPKYSRC